ncbi:hypothetical protein P8452_55890 [Trifolium repens]|nr:hypothetical protein P8452_55890 [Trifolium repens]
MTTLVIHKGIEKSIFNKGFSQRVIGVVGFGKSRLTLELTKVSQQQNRWCWLYLGSDLHDYTMVKSLSLLFYNSVLEFTGLDCFLHTSSLHLKKMWRNPIWQDRHARHEMDTHRTIKDDIDEAFKDLDAQDLDLCY